MYASDSVLHLSREIAVISTLRYQRDPLRLLCNFFPFVEEQMLTMRGNHYLTGEDQIGSELVQYVVNVDQAFLLDSSPNSSLSHR